ELGYVVAVRWSFGTQSWNLNGPVPIGFRGHVLSSFSCAGAAIPRRPVDHRKAGNATHGTEVVTRTVIGSTTETSLMSPKTRPNRTPLRYRSKLSFTASAFSGSPLWNWMPSRSAIVHCV